MKKIAAPKNEAAINTNANNTTVPKRLKAPYQRRCLKALIIAPVDRSDLDKAIGTTNAPEYIRQLKEKGLSINTTKVKGINRDGRKIWWGRYVLDAGSLAKARAMLGDD